MSEKSARSALLAGAAACALLLAQPASVQAQSLVAGPGWYFSLEGRYSWNEGDKVGALDQAFQGHPDTAKANAENGFGGRATVGYRFSGPWDVGFGLSGQFLRGKDGFVSPDANERIKVRLNYYTADFEAGYTMALGTSSMARLFGGVRGAVFNQKAKANVVNDTNDQYAGERKTTYWGIGPRIGANAQFGMGGGFHIFGGVAGALLLGKYKDKTAFGYGNLGPPTNFYSYKDASKTKLVPNLEGELGLGYTFMSGNTALSLQAGYRGDAAWGAVTKTPVVRYANYPGTPPLSSARAGDVFDHGPFVRLTIQTGAPAPVATAAPPPAAAMAKTYIVFFDWDRSTLTPDAIKTIADAAAASKTGGVQRVNVTGHADRSGSDQYNMALSLRRAGAVKDQLIRNGVPANAIVVVGRGESQPLVPTADGVREPQNRRVEIVLN